MNDLGSRVAITSAKLGAALWLGLAALTLARRTPLAILDLLFLLAVLVVVPLGMPLFDSTSTADRFPRLRLVSYAMQPQAALMAVASFWFPRGQFAAALSTGWLAFGVVMLLRGLLALMTIRRSLRQTAFTVATFDLAFAAAWFLASRLGIRPMSFDEPIILLTGVHFHFSGFATALLAGTSLHHWEPASVNRRRWLQVLVIALVFAPFLIAAGFVFSPALRFLAVLVFSLALLGFSVLQFISADRFTSESARLLLCLSSLCVFAGMIMVVIYSLGEFTGTAWLTIPLMVRLHGPLNGAGFVLLGLLGWTFELRAERVFAEKLRSSSFASVGVRTRRAV